MIFDKLGIAKLIKNWEKAIADKKLSHAEMMDDGSLIVHKIVEADVLGKKIVNSLIDQYKADDLANQALLSITGPMKPGDVHRFNNFISDFSYEEMWTPETLEKALIDGFVNRVELSTDGRFLLWVKREPGKTDKAMEFQSAPFVKAIQKFTGPLSHGQVFYFDQKPDKE